MRKRLKKTIYDRTITILLLGEVKPVHATHIDRHAFRPPHRV